MTYKLKVYKTEKSAHGAVKRQGLHLMNYEVRPHCSARGTGFEAFFYVLDMQDLDEVKSRGFEAKINVEKAY